MLCRAVYVSLLKCGFFVNKIQINSEVKLFRELHLLCFNLPRPMFQHTPGVGLVETFEVTTKIALQCQCDLY